MTARRPDKAFAEDERQSSPHTDQDDPPIRLAHVLFVIWVAGSVAWALFAAKLAHDRDWFVQQPELAVILVLAPPILAYVLANFVIRVTKNPRFYS